MSRSEDVAGERVFGPPLGTDDADRVASAALEAASASPEVVRRLAAAAWPALRAVARTSRPRCGRPCREDGGDPAG